MLRWQPFCLEQNWEYSRSRACEGNPVASQGRMGGLFIRSQSSKVRMPYEYCVPVLKKYYKKQLEFPFLFFSFKASHKCQPVLYETRPMTTSQYSPGSWTGFWMDMTTDCGLGWEVSVWGLWRSREKSPSAIAICWLNFWQFLKRENCFARILSGELIYLVSCVIMCYYSWGQGEVVSLSHHWRLLAFQIIWQSSLVPSRGTKFLGAVNAKNAVY